MSPAIRENDYAKGNPGGGAPEGNQNAVGNDGGAPELNANAATHHGWADPLKHYERLRYVRPPAAAPALSSPFDHMDESDDAADAFEWVTDLVAEYVENYALVHDMDREAVEADGDLMDRFRALGAMLDQEFRTHRQVFEGGIMVEREIEYEGADSETRTYTTDVVNPASKAGLRLSQRARNERVRLGINGRNVQRARRESDVFGEHLDEMEDRDAVADPDRPRAGLEGDAAVAAITQGIGTDTDTDTDAVPGPDVGPGETPASGTGAVATDGGSVEATNVGPGTAAEPDDDTADGSSDTEFRVPKFGGWVA